MAKLSKNLFKIYKSQSGFSLVELLITLVITSIVMSAVIIVYSSTMHTSRAEDQRVDLQQNHRFAVDLLMANLRHAGYDKWEKNNASIVKAGVDYIYFTADLQGCTENLSPGECADPGSPKLDPDGIFPDGEIDDNGEHIVFSRYTENGEVYFGYVNSADSTYGDLIDADNDGLADAGIGPPAIPFQRLISVDGVEFLYTLSTGGPTTFPATALELERIRSVQIGLLARNASPDIKFNHPASLTYARPSGGVWTNFSDNFRRRLLTAEVRFRNMGLE